MKFILRWLAIAFAVAIAVAVVGGIDIGSGASFWWTLLVVALLVGLLNATLGALLKTLSFPIMLLTLGLFGVVVNAFMLQFAAWIANGIFGTDFVINSFWSAFVASIIISLVMMLASVLLPDDDGKRKKGARF
jgi:putative membrane protein